MSRRQCFTFQCERSERLILGQEYLSGDMFEKMREPLDADLSEQAVDLSDDEALAGVDEVLREEIRDIKAALLRIENGNYGVCSSCGGKIGTARLEALPTATRCIGCA